MEPAEIVPRHDHNVFIENVFDVFTVNTGITLYVTTEFGIGLALVGVVMARVFWKLGNSGAPAKGISELMHALARGEWAAKASIRRIPSCSGQCLTADELTISACFSRQLVLILRVAYHFTHPDYEPDYNTLVHDGSAH